MEKVKIYRNKGGATHYVERIGVQGNVEKLTPDRAKAGQFTREESEKLARFYQHKPDAGDFSPLREGDADPPSNAWGPKWDRGFGLESAATRGPIRTVGMAQHPPSPPAEVKIVNPEGRPTIDTPGEFATDQPKPFVIPPDPDATKPDAAKPAHGTDLPERKTEAGKAPEKHTATHEGGPKEVLPPAKVTQHPAHKPDAKK